MKPSRFDYSAPTTVSETVSVLADEGSDAKILAGGQSLVPILNFRMASPARLVDINGVTELDYVRGNGITAIGAMTRLTTLEGAETSAIVDKALPHIGHRAIRNRGTLGGSLAHNDPAAELPAVLMVLDGEVTAVSSSGERTLSVTDLVGERFLETTLAPTGAHHGDQDSGVRTGHRLRIRRVCSPPRRLRHRRGRCVDHPQRIHDRGCGAGRIWRHPCHPSPGG